MNKNLAMSPWKKFCSKYLTVLAMSVITFACVYLWRSYCSGLGDDVWFSHVAQDPYQDPMEADDVHQVSSWTDVFNLIRLTYLTDNGRLSNYWLIVSQYLTPDWLGSLGAAFTMTLIPLLMLLLIGRGAFSRKTMVLLSFWSMWLLFPWSFMVQTTFFLTYYPTLVLLLLSIFVANEAYSNPELTPLDKTFALILCLITGWWHEISAFPLATYLFVMVLIKFKDRDNTSSRSLLIWMLVFTVIGIILEDSSPGQWGRFFNTSNRPSTFTGLFNEIGSRIVALYGLPIIAFVLVALSHRKLGYQKVDYLPMCAAILCGMALLVVLKVGARMSLNFTALTLILLFGMYNQWMNIRGKKLHYPNVGLHQTGRTYGSTSSSTLHVLGNVVTTVFVILYWVFLAQVALWEGRIRADRDNVHSQMLRENSSVVFADVYSERDIPWWSKLVVEKSWDDPWYIWNATTPVGRFHYVSALPAKMEGKKFSQWDKIPGNNNFRGSVDQLISTEKADTMFVNITFSEATPSLTPWWKAAWYLKGQPRQKTVMCLQQPLGEYMGDSLYVYRPQDLGRIFTSLEIEKVDQVKMPQDWTAPIPEPLPRGKWSE